MGSRRSTTGRRRLPPRRLLQAGVERAFARAVADLEESGAQTAVVGGLAVGARASPRVTRDVDFAVAVTGDAAAEGLIHQLLGHGWRVEATLEHDSGRLATVRLTAPRVEGVLVDLLFFFAGIEQEIVAGAPWIELLGRRVRVATVAQLLAMKVIAARDKDLADVGLLLEVATAGDIAAARKLLRLAMGRGVERGRDLARELHALASRQRASSRRFHVVRRSFGR